MKLPVLIAAGGAAWEAELVAALDSSGGPIQIARRCVDVVDLLAVGRGRPGPGRPIDARLRRLDADAIDRLRAAQVIPVGVVPRGDTAAEDRLRAAGIAHFVPADADPGSSPPSYWARSSSTADEPAPVPLARSAIRRRPWHYRPAPPRTRHRASPAATGR